MKMGGLENERSAKRVVARVDHKFVLELFPIVLDRNGPIGAKTVYFSIPHIKFQGPASLSVYTAYSFFVRGYLLLICDIC